MSLHGRKGLTLHHTSLRSEPHPGIQRHNVLFSSTFSVSSPSEPLSDLLPYPSPQNTSLITLPVWWQGLNFSTSQPRLELFSLPLKSLPLNIVTSKLSYKEIPDSEFWSFMRSPWALIHTCLPESTLGCLTLTGPLHQSWLLLMWKRSDWHYIMPTCLIFLYNSETKQGLLHSLTMILKEPHVRLTCSRMPAWTKCPNPIYIRGNLEQSAPFFVLYAN